MVTIITDQHPAIQFTSGLRKKVDIRWSKMAWKELFSESSKHRIVHAILSNITRCQSKESETYNVLIGWEYMGFHPPPPLWIDKWVSKVQYPDSRVPFSKLTSEAKFIREGRTHPPDPQCPPPCYCTWSERKSNFFGWLAVWEYNFFPRFWK